MRVKKDELYYFLSDLFCLSDSSSKSEIARRPFTTAEAPFSLAYLFAFKCEIISGCFLQ